MVMQNKALICALLVLINSQYASNIIQVDAAHCGG